MISLAFRPVRGSGTIKGLRTGRNASEMFAVRISHHDLYVFAHRWRVGHHMAC